MLLSGQLRQAFAFNLEAVTIKRPNRDAAKVILRLQTADRAETVSLNVQEQKIGTLNHATCQTVFAMLCALNKRGNIGGLVSACSSFIELSSGTKCIPGLSSGTVFAIE